MEKTHADHGTRVVTDLTFEKAVEVVTDALGSEGFGVLTKIDVQATLKEKLDAEFRRYVILGACNPSLAFQALNAEIEVGLLLPCNVIVYEQNGGSVVAIVNAISMLGVIDNPELEPIASEAKARLDRVIETMQGQG
ncbi:MAG: DUF302 domain-containing protein [Anaerolineae bacterium]|nr:MAG: DUF302 domain-containing protein [Anaerolineae bacterium]